MYKYFFKKVVNVEFCCIFACIYELGASERQCLETVFRVPRTDTQKLVGEAEKVEAKFKIHLKWQV